jgi:cholesterol oxidase
MLTIVRDAPLPPGSPEFDAVIVGSGFGGSVVAHRLAHAGWEVCVLERGCWHRPGTFPRTPGEVKRSFWDPSHRLYGLFDVWSFRGLVAVVASGMGGGSLVYANVLAPPPDAWMRVAGPDGGPWPVDPDELAPHYQAVTDLLRPVPYPRVAPFDATRKTELFEKAAAVAGLDVDRPPLAIQFTDDRGRHGVRLPFDKPARNHSRVQRQTCEILGECDLGCNLGAKHTLDLTLLSEIERMGNVTIRELSEARGIRPRPGGGFAVDVLDHSASAEESAVPPRTRTVTASKLILAAGTFGTALLLHRSRVEFPRLSQALGRSFCSNGDYLAFAAGCDGADGAESLMASRGPVITVSARGLDRSEGGDGPGFHLQDGGFPSWAGWLGLLGGIRRDVARLEVEARTIIQGPLRGSPKQNLSYTLSQLIDGDSERVLPILSLGRDIPDGRLHLRQNRLDLDWRKDSAAALYARTESAARLLTSALGGHYVDPLRFVRPVTVHPLGGCAMSQGDRTGVVDPQGCVHHVDGLSITDGSILPGPVGINPALTIAALAHRHGDFLASQGRPPR